jgi:predicted transcriptional regulator of viral defense system
MNNSERFKILIDTQRTVFTPQDLRQLWQANEHAAKISAIRMVEKGLIIRIAKGYYAPNDRYNPHELANRIVTPSYVSLNTALFYANVNFQYRNEICSVATLDYAKKIGKVLFSYVAMKKNLFYTLEGITQHDGISIALPERAILDCFYFGFLPDIDDEDKINKTYLVKLSHHYPKTVQKKIQRLL